MTPILRFYAWLLRLYPPAFRDVFAAEMLDVFRRRLSEPDRHAVVLLVLHEVAGVLVGAARERMAARRRRQLDLIGQGRIAGPWAIYRFCVVTLFVLLTAFVLLLVVPFYAYGLHLQPAAQVMGGAFDPKGLPLYDPYTLVGAVVHLSVLLLIVFAPFGTVGFGALLVFTLGRLWLVLDRRRQVLGLLALASGAGFYALLFSSIGHLLITWFMD